MVKPMDFVFDISGKKKNLLKDDPDNLKQYNPFLTGMAFSMNVETILAANEVNKCPGLPKDWHHDFLFHAIPKRWRKFPWKKATSVEDIEMVQNYFECNANRANEYLRVLTKADLKKIRAYYDEGGVR